MRWGVKDRRKRESRVNSSPSSVFSYFYSIVEREKRIARELDASAKWEARGGGVRTSLAPAPSCFALAYLAFFCIEQWRGSKQYLKPACVADFLGSDFFFNSETISNGNSTTNTLLSCSITILHLCKFKAEKMETRLKLNFIYFAPHFNNSIPRH